MSSDLNTKLNYWVSNVNQISTELSQIDQLDQQDYDAYVEKVEFCFEAYKSFESKGKSLANRVVINTKPLMSKIDECMNRLTVLKFNSVKAPVAPMEKIELSPQQKQAQTTLKKAASSLKAAEQDFTEIRMTNPNLRNLSPEDMLKKLQSMREKTTDLKNVANIDICIDIVEKYQRAKNTFKLAYEFAVTDFIRSPFVETFKMIDVN